MEVTRQWLFCWGILCWTWQSDTSMTYPCGDSWALSGTSPCPVESVTAQAHWVMSSLTGTPFQVAFSAYAPVVTEKWEQWKQKSGLCFPSSSSFASHSPDEIPAFTDNKLKVLAQVPGKLLQGKSLLQSAEQGENVEERKPRLKYLRAGRGRSYWKARKMRELGWGGGNWVVKVHQGAIKGEKGLATLF